MGLQIVTSLCLTERVQSGYMGDDGFHVISHTQGWRERGGGGRGGTPPPIIEKLYFQDARVLSLCMDDRFILIGVEAAIR